MSPERSHLCISLGRSAGCTATLAAVGPLGASGELPPHAAAMRMTASPASNLRSTGLSLTAMGRPPNSLEEDRPTSRKQIPQSPLDPVANLFSQLEDEPRVVGGFGTEVGNLDGFSERDEPLRRKRNQPGKTQPGEGRRDRDGGQAEPPGHGLEVEYHRMQLFRTNDRDRDDR